jgi:hypothetical protein
MPQQGLLFLAWNTLGGIFLDQEQKVPGNPKIPGIFQANPDLRLVTGTTH